VALCINSDHLDRSVYGPAIDTSSTLNQFFHLQSGKKVTDFENASLDVHQEDIDVLRLSRTVFISTVDFSLSLPEASLALSEYQVSLRSDKGDRNSVILHAYSCSSFEEATMAPTQATASVLPLDFLCHLISSLPEWLQADCFTHLLLTRTNPQSLAVEYFVRFLSIIPSNAPLSKRRICDDKYWIIFEIGGDISKEELRAIVSHRFHLDVKLSLLGSLFNETPMRESVTMDDINSVLKQRRDLRCISLSLPSEDSSIRMPLVGHECPEPSFGFEDVTFESLDFTINCYGPMSIRSFDATTVTHAVKTVKMHFSDEFWPVDADGCQEALRSLLQHFFLGDSSVQRLEIIIGVETDGFSQADLFGWFSGAIKRISSMTLRYCKIVFRDCFEADLEISTSLDALNVWDMFVSPTLLLNYLRISFSFGQRRKLVSIHHRKCSL
jgi:hypothetical protein